MPAEGVAYSALDTQAYERDDANTTAGGHFSETRDSGAGDDRIDDETSPILTGGNEFHGGEGDDSIWGGTGADNITAGSGNDTLDGADGDDTLAWEDGLDPMNGGLGDDSLWGDAGSDRFYIGNFDCTDTIFGSEAGDSSDVDALDCLWASDPLSVSFGSWEFGSDEVGTAGSTGQFWEIEHVVGGNGADTTDASASGSAAQVYRMSGDDSPTGSGRADSIDGGDGVDTITRGAGDNTLSGGDGRDRFALSADGGADTITDFDMTPVGDGGTADQFDTSTPRDGRGRDGPHMGCVGQRRRLGQCGIGPSHRREPSC